MCSLFYHAHAAISSLNIQQHHPITAASQFSHSAQTAQLIHRVPTSNCIKSYHQSAAAGGLDIFYFLPPTNALLNEAVAFFSYDFEFIADQSRSGTRYLYIFNQQPFKEKFQILSTNKFTVKHQGRQRNGITERITYDPLRAIRPYISGEWQSVCR